jgi:CelD/BcsL family acetyltransferase involved in cellulose biosynthesis
MLEAAKGWLRMYVLYLNGKPSAYWWGVVYGETFHSCALGYDPEFHNYSPGSYLLTKGLESLCQQGVKELDFGLGDARYKQQFGDNNYKEATISLFAQTLQGISLNCILSLNNVMTLIAKRILKRFKIIETLKKHWRSKLRPVDDEA